MNDPLDQLRLRFSGLRLVSETSHGQVYAGQDFTGVDVTVAVLSEAAAADPGTRNAFADAVWRHSPGAVPEAAAVHAADLHAGRPWAAIRNPVGQPGAEQLFAGLGAGLAGAAAPPADPFDSPVVPAAPPPPAPPQAVPPPPAAPPTAPAYPPPTAPAYPPPTAPAYPPAAPASPAGYYPPAAPASPAGYYPPAAPASPAGYPGSPAAYPPPAAPASPAAYGQGYGGYGPPPGVVPQPGYGADPGLPGGQPAKSKSPWPWLIAVGASVVALVVLVGVVVVVVRTLGEEEVDRPVTVPQQPQPNPPPPPGEPPPPPSSGEPELRDVEPVSLIGPTFGEDEDTYTMAFGGWPFAFRTPGSWGCRAGEFEPIPEALLWTCIDEQDSSNGQRVSVMLWECPTSCTADEQDEMINRWLDEPEEAERQEDPLVAYVEYEENTNGNWAIDLSHFGGAGGDLRWHVGVYAESPPDTQETVQKIVNDILTQAS